MNNNRFLSRNAFMIVSIIATSYCSNVLYVTGDNNNNKPWFLRRGLDTSKLDERLSGNAAKSEEPDYMRRIFLSSLQADADYLEGATLESGEDISDFLESADRRRQLLTAVGLKRGAFTMSGIPIVYHVLPNDAKGFNPTGKTQATDKQLEYQTKVLNESFNIYDKIAKKSVQFATFVYDARIVHDDFYSDNNSWYLDSEELAYLVKKVDNWEYKIHVLIGEIYGFPLGYGTWPWDYVDDDSPLSNLIWMDHRSIGCFDDAGTFLCDLTDGKEESLAMAGATESKTLVTLMGHVFGLFNTFNSYPRDPEECDAWLRSGDLVLDTPAETRGVGDVVWDCPGLLPYDPDRDMFDEDLMEYKNTGASAEVCGGEDQVCDDNTCAACHCTEEICVDYFFISETDDNAGPYCCGDRKPQDSCPKTPGIDPKTNFMTFAHDKCTNEFTPGQLVRMMAQVFAMKEYFYCNYADTNDDLCRIKEIPCGPYATSPTCNDVCPMTGRLFNTEFGSLPQKILDDKVDLCLYGGAPLSLEGNAPCAKSVTMKLLDGDGNVILKKKEGNKPYMLGGDIDAEGKLLPVKQLQTPGTYTFEIKQTGSRKEYSKTFVVDYFCGCEIEFVLWYAGGEDSRNFPLGPLDGGTFNLCVLKDVPLSIEAVARCNPEYVKLELIDSYWYPDKVVMKRKEMKAPYMLAGDKKKNGDLVVNKLPADITDGYGIYTLNAEYMDTTTKKIYTKTTYIEVDWYDC